MTPDERTEACEAVRVLHRQAQLAPVPEEAHMKCGQAFRFLLDLLTLETSLLSTSEMKAAMRQLPA